MNSKNLESAILKAVARVRPDKWLPCSLGDLRLRMKDFDSDAVNASMNSIMEAAAFLVDEGYVLLGKRVDGGRRLPFDLQKQFDEGALNTNTKSTRSLPEGRFAAFEDIANVFADCGILKTTRFIGDFRKEARSMRPTMGDDHLIRVGIHD